MPTTCAIRKVSNITGHEPEYLNIPINGLPPFTQDQVSGALHQYDNFSSPIQNYSITMGNPIELKHTLSAQERLATHRHATANIKLDMEKMLEQQKKEREQERKEREQERREHEQERREREQERREREDDRKKREQERKERDENEKVLLEYEIFDRIAQGLNDYLIARLDSISQDILFYSKVNYLPLLLTTWCFKWSDDFPLPDCLQGLPEHVAAKIQKPKYKSLIHEALDSVAGLIWNENEQECLVMMACYANRPQKRITIAHQRTTVAAAATQINNSSLFIDVKLKEIALHILQNKALFDNSETSDKGVASMEDS